MLSTPNPGSKAALAAGCRCPVLDNHHGEGFGDPPKFWISGDCQLHGVTKPSEIHKQGEP